MGSVKVTILLFFVVIICSSAHRGKYNYVGPLRLDILILLGVHNMRYADFNKVKTLPIVWKIVKLSSFLLILESLGK